MISSLLISALINGLVRAQSLPTAEQGDARLVCGRFGGLVAAGCGQVVLRTVAVRGGFCESDELCRVMCIVEKVGIRLLSSSPSLSSCSLGLVLRLPAEKVRNQELQIGNVGSRCRTPVEEEERMSNKVLRSCHSRSRDARSRVQMVWGRSLVSVRVENETNCFEHN